MYYLLILKSDIMIKKFSINLTKLLSLTFKFIAFKMRVKVILSADGLTIDLSERKPLRHKRSTGIGAVQ